MATSLKLRNDPHRQKGANPNGPHTPAEQLGWEDLVSPARRWLANKFNKNRRTPAPPHRLLACSAKPLADLHEPLNQDATVAPHLWWGRPATGTLKARSQVMRWYHLTRTGDACRKGAALKPRPQIQRPSKSSRPATSVLLNVAWKLPQELQPRAHYFAH